MNTRTKNGPAVLPRQKMPLLPPEPYEEEPIEYPEDRVLDAGPVPSKLKPFRRGLEVQDEVAIIGALALAVVFLVTFGAPLIRALSHMLSL